MSSISFSFLVPALLNSHPSHSLTFAPDCNLRRGLDPHDHLLAACQQSSNSALTIVAQKPNSSSQHAILEEIGSQKLQQTKRMATPKPNFGISSFVSTGDYFQSKCLKVCHDQLLQANDKPNLKATTLKCRGSKHLRCTVDVREVRGSVLECPRRNPMNVCAYHWPQLWNKSLLKCLCSNRTIICPNLNFCSFWSLKSPILRILLKGNYL